MKIHITNLYNFNPNDELVATQHRFADAGRELGFHEMGIFSYPVETDTPSELSKRLDGIIAALEPEDVVFMQLPTRNGFIYENLLFQKIKAYRAKVVFILHNIQMISDSNVALQEKYLSLFKQADAIIAPSSDESNLLESNDLKKLLFCDCITITDSALSNICNTLSKTNFYIKKTFFDAIDLIFSNALLQLQAESQTYENEIPIGFGLHDKTGNYSMWVGVTMQSIIEHTDAKLCFHILHDKTLTDTNKEKLSSIAISNKHHIFFHLIDDTIFYDISNQVGIFTIGTMFRVMLPELLPNLSKIIYLDADILVNRDIKELWNINIDGKYLAAVPDMGIVRNAGIPVPVRNKQVSASNYFNAGVLYLNLNMIKQHGNMKNAVLEYLKNNKDSHLPDQDALNVLYGKNAIFLDESWNYFAGYVRYSAEKELYKRIYHFAGTRLILFTSTAMDQAYYETLCRTPWGLEEGHKQLKHALELTMEHTIQLRKALHEISATSKKKIFYGPENHVMKNLYNLLAIDEKDYRILKEPDQNTNSVLSCMSFSTLENETPGGYIVFVLPIADNFTALKNLNNLGLKQGKDYFIINQLLSPEQGGYI